MPSTHWLLLFALVAPGIAGQAPAPQPSVAESREDPAGAVRVKPDAPVTPFSAPLPPTEAIVSASPPAPEPPPAVRAPVAALDEGVTAVERVPVDLPPVSAPVAARARPVRMASTMLVPSASSSRSTPEITGAGKSMPISA